MASTTHRRRLLVALAVLNLVLWSVVALAIVLLASDRLDLGIETFIRGYQSTAVTSLQPYWPRQVGPTGQHVNTTQGAPLPITSGESGLPAGTLSNSPGSEASQAGGPQMPELASESTPTPIPAVAEATLAAAAPSGELARDPLLLSDPGPADLVSLGAELGQSASGRLIQLSFQQAALNREIDKLLRDNPDFPYHDLYLELRRSQVSAAADVSVLGIRMRAEVLGKVEAWDCRPRVTVLRVSLVGLATPRFVRDGVQSQIEELLSSYPADYPLCLDQIVIDAGSATVYGHRP